MEQERTSFEIAITFARRVLIVAALLPVFFYCLDWGCFSWSMAADLAGRPAIRGTGLGPNLMNDIVQRLTWEIRLQAVFFLTILWLTIGAMSYPFVSSDRTPFRLWKIFASGQFPILIPEFDDWLRR